MDCNLPPSGPFFHLEYKRIWDPTGWNSVCDGQVEKDDPAKERRYDQRCKKKEIKSIVSWKPKRKICQHAKCCCDQ